jgi:hypothetical protein
MRQLWVGLIVIIVALALGLGAAFGASLLVRNRMVNLPSTATRLNRNLPSGQPGNNNNLRRFNNPYMNPGGQQGFGPFGFWNWGGNGPMMGPGTRGFRNFNNCPVPNQPNGQGQTPGQPQTTCPPLRRFNRQGTQSTPEAPSAPATPATPAAPAAPVTPVTPTPDNSNGPF